MHFCGSVECKLSVALPFVSFNTPLVPQMSKASEAHRQDKT